MQSFIEALERRALLSGEIDTTFGTNGVAPGGTSATVKRFKQVATADDGKIYIAGNLGGLTYVSRYTAAGQLDTTYGGTGHVRVTMPGGYQLSVNGMALRGDGEIYLSGIASANGNSGWNAGVAAVKPDGTLDETFNGTGFWTAKWNGALYSQAGEVVLYDNKLYVGGNDNSGYMHLARFTTAGVIDSSFAGTGVADYFVGSTIDLSRYEPELDLLPFPGAAPRLVVSTATANYPILLSYSLTGVRDTQRPVSPTASYTNFLMSDVTTDTNGRVILGGSTGSSAAVVRLRFDGYLDTQFDTDGIYSTGVTQGISAVAATKDGQIVAALAPVATAAVTSGNSGALYLLPDGRPNAAAFNNGVGALPVGRVTDTFVQPDGKILLTSIPSRPDFFDAQLARLNAPPAPAGIDGYLFDDVNGDGIQNDTGGRLTFYGMAAYLDLNGNSALDDNEPSSYAGNGKFVFENLAPNTQYTVRLQIYPGITARQTAPTNNGAFVVNTTGRYNAAGPFGVSFTLPPATFTVSGTAFIDTNKNGTPDGTEVDDHNLFSWYVFVDTNNSGGLDDDDTFVTTVGGSNRYTLTLPADGRIYRVQLRNENAEPFTTARSYDVSSTTGQPLTGRDFGIAPVAAGASASGIVFDDANQNGEQDAGEAGIANVVAYVDVDNDKILDAGEVWTTTDGAGAYGFGNLPDTGSATRLRAILPTGGKQTTPVDGKGYGLTLAIGATNPGKHFGVYTPPPAPVLGSLSGFCFDDTDKDGVLDSNEKKTSGKTVFLDADNDGVLDTNEKKTTTATDGSWSFGGLAAGEYHVRRVFPSGYAPSTAPVDVTLAAGQAIADLAIGSKSGSTPPANTASITGTVFADNNKNGKYDSGDGYGKGVVVFLDADNDGKLDTGETSVTTDSSGKFNFTKLAAGTYRVRRVMPSGYTYSTTKPDVTLTAGQAKTGVLIGTKKA